MLSTLHDVVDGVVRTALMGLIGFLPTKGMALSRPVLMLANGAIGGVDFAPEERKRISAAYLHF